MFWAISRVFILIFAVFVGQSSFAVAIAVSAISELNFGTAAQGDPLKTVPPGTSENAENASYRVTGDPNRAFTITLPANGNMTTTGGTGANYRISVTAFVSFPAAGANGLLNGSGQQMVYLGATRAAIRVTQIVGTYTRTIRLTVVY